jgi:hypothetical protein
VRASHIEATLERAVRRTRKLLKKCAASTLRIFQDRFSHLYSWKGFMGRYASGIFFIASTLACIFLAGCGSSNPTQVVNNPVPNSVSLAPAPDVSLEVGKIQGFIPTARNLRNQVLTERFTFESSNPAVLTIASNGTACAGTWNSLTVPQVCTPGPTGVAQVTATARGVTSPPVTVYVHQHITNIVIQKVPGQPGTLSNACLSKGAPAGPESQVYEAMAFNGGTDITSTVGLFTWQAVNPNFAKLSAPPANAPLNRQIVKAGDPGSTAFFASVSGINSQPVQFTTCPVQSISLSAVGNPGKSFVVNTGTSTTLNASVTDSIGMTLTAVPLTWTSSNPISVSASGSNTGTVFGSVGTASASAIGASVVIASCTPPSCNGGLKPSLPIYPQDAVSFTVNSNNAPANPTVYATTTACSTTNPTNAACEATIVPITKSSSSSAFSAGSPVALQSSPNSIIFDPKGTNAFLGVDSSNFGQSGVMVFNGSSISASTAAAGKVLAVSPDGTLAVVSDTSDTPNQVFVFNNSTRTAASFLIDGVSAAAFSPDSLKAYIVAGSTLFVYSKVDAIHSIGLGATANDVAFFPQGAFAFLAGGSSSAVTVRHTCDNSLADTVGTTATPSMLRALPDAATILALEPPLIEYISAGHPSNGTWEGCAPGITDSITSTFNLGQGNFTARQFLISSNGATGYIMADTPGPNPAPLPSIIKFDIPTQASSLISLANGATPLSASLSPTGNLLFVGASDGDVHVIDTTDNEDIQQVTFDFPQHTLCFGPGSPSTRVPQSQLSISAASQNGSTTTYSYTLISGVPLKVGQTIVISGMSDGANNGTFTITALGTGTFSVENASGVTDSGQNGTGIVPITCNPDLVAVKP